MREFPKRFLSLRDKNGPHRRSKSVPPGTASSDKSRPLSAETLFSLFKNDNSSKNAAKPENESEREKQEEKIHDIQRRLGELNIPNVTPDHIRAIMATKFAEGDAEKTAEFINIEQKSVAGKIVPYDPNTHMLGAENRGGVTCYIDALLFAMFSRLDAFECMLKNDFPNDEPKKRLVTLIRIWVNMLRSGKLIRTDMTKVIQETLGDCGWADARLLEQQDTSEAFAFLTETLQLPLLSLQVDLFHQGKGETDDHKVVYERLLNLAVPPDPEGKGIKLEDCLEEYFNARVDVLRDSEESKRSATEDSRSGDAPTLVHRNTIRLVRGEESVASTTMTASPVDVSPLHKADFPGDVTDINESPGPSQSSNGPIDAAQTSAGVETESITRQRAGSVIQRVMVDSDGRPSTTDDATTRSRRANRKGSIVVKAVTIPAWQFFRLIPWHAVSSNEPQSDVDVAMNFDQRPVVGICLKRYAMTESGQPKRHNTYIDIPDSLRLPHFMMAGSPKADETANGLNTEYKLVLQSIVCHRGESLQSGHYVSFARVAPKLLSDNRRHDFDPPPDYEEAQWVRFDDLEEKRVAYVDNLKKSLQEEMPYLLFYQIMPMVDATCPSTEGTSTEPPSYNDSKVSIEISPSTTANGGSASGISQRTGSLVSENPAFDSPPFLQNKPPSIRLSAEYERPSRKYFETVEPESNMGSTPGGSRRQSTNYYTDSTGMTPAMTPESHSPVIAPSDDLSTASRLSRAASRFTLGRQSRPASQSGEGRKSNTMSRLGFTKNSKEEPLAEPNNLSVLTSSANERPISDATSQPPDSPVLVGGPSTQQQPPKQKRKKGKSKETPKKEKSASQPERECTVM